MTALTKKEAKQLLFAEIGQALAADGFDPKPKGQSLYKRIDGGVAAFHLSFIDHNAEFDLVLNTAVRLDAVEEMIQGLPSRKLTTFTLGTEFGRYVGSGQKRWTIAGPGDISQVAREITSVFREYLMPFIEKYRVPERVWPLRVTEKRRLPNQALLAA